MTILNLNLNLFSDLKIDLNNDSMDKIDINIRGWEKITEKPLPNKFWLSIVGPPGSFKTIFCINVTNNLIQKGFKCIYVSTEMSSSEVISQALSLRFNWKKIVNDKDLIIVDTENQSWVNGKLKDKIPSNSNEDLVNFITLSDAIRHIRMNWDLTDKVIMVIDSVASLWEDKPAMSRKFFRFIKRQTQIYFDLVLITSQLAIGTSHAFGFGIEHGVDGILRTGEYFEDGEMKNWILCVKLRSINPNRKLFSTDVDLHGFIIKDEIDIKGRYSDIYDVFSH